MIKVKEAYAVVIGITLILGCSATKGTNQTFPPPKLPLGEEQKRRYQAEQEQQAALEKEMQERGARLRAEIAAHPNKQVGTKVLATRCGDFFLYYDYGFMNSDYGRMRMFTFPHSLRKAKVPFGFTVSYTPPDADVEWIDEVETGTYSLPHQKRGLYVHSRGRKIPRGKVVPVPYYHSQSYHDEIYIRGVFYGEGEVYEYVE
ncbi:MAG: hypothetical protein HOP32_14195 [Nitrospira sp.]|nr:hypothetical protein [Nitrospira sp.]